MYTRIIVQLADIAFENKIILILHKPKINPNGVLGFWGFGVLGFRV